MSYKIKITLFHHLEHIHTGSGDKNLDKFLSNEEQWTYVISVEDTDTGKGVAFSAIGVCPLGEDKVDPLSDDVAHPIYRTKRELQFKGLFPDFNAHFEKYGSFYDAEIKEVEKEFGKEAA